MYQTVQHDDARPDVAAALLEPRATGRVYDSSHGAQPSGSSSTRVNRGKRSYMRVCEHESENIRDAMTKSSGNQAQAARLLGMTARQFRYRLSKLGSEISHV